MAFILSDRIKETSTTSGTGAVTLGSAYGGFQTFASGIGDGNKTYYGIEDGVNWEIGIGTYTLSSNSISRDVVLSSSTGSKLSLSGGVSTVFCTYPANRSFIMTQDGYASGVSPYYSGILFPDGTTQITSATGDISAPLTVKRTDAGDLFHFYVDNDNDRTVALNLENSSTPTWKIGLKDGPSNKTAAPTYGYVYGNNGSAGVYATSDSALIVNYSNGAWIKHRDSDLFNLSKSGGAKFLNAEAAVVPVKVRGANSQSAHLQVWENNSQSTLAYVDYAGVISGVKLKTASLEFRDGSIMSSAGEGMSSGDLVSFLTNDAGYITAHPTISTASGSTNFAGRTYIQNILFDQFGHVSGVSVGTETVADTNTTYTAGSGLTLDGTTFKIDTNSTVLESGRNVSLLTNDAGYTTYTGFELYLDGADLSKTIRSSDFLNIDAGSNVTVSYLNTSNGSGHNVTINAVQKTTEEIQDIVGAMFSGNTETNITATYQDADGTIDLVSTDTTYTAGSGIVLNGTQINIPTATASTAGLVTLSNTVADNANVVATSKAVYDAGYLTAHPSVSQGSNINLDNSDGTVIQDLQITLDSNGHVTTSTAGTIDLDGRYFTESELTGGQLDSRYYTESELNTSGGGGQVHWNNVTNKPTIGDITAIVAGSGMSGGGTESSVTVNVDLQQLANGAMISTDQMVFIDSDGSSKRTPVSTVTSVIGAGFLADTALTGNPTAPTQHSSNNSTRLATTAYVTTAISNLVDGAPGALNTLNELAAAINDSGNYAAGITSLLSEKAYTYDLAAASGNLDNRLHEVSGAGGQVLTASGYLYTDILSVSGIAGGGETNQNAFSIVAVSGQTNVEADAKTDTLTLAGGSNVTITTSGDTVTMAATDTNTTYTAGSGISLNGTQFNVGISGNNILATNSPVNNYVPSYVNGEFTWVAQTSDTNTTYTAGSGLVLHGTQFDTAISGDNLLATNTPTDNYVPSWDASTRKFTWVAQTADTNTTYTAGSGLKLHGTAFQAAVSGDNLLATNTPTDNYVPSWDASTRKFTWVAQPSDTNTTYTAGSGLVLHGTQFDSAISGYNLLATNSPVDNYIPSFDAATGKFTWTAAGAGEANQNAFSTVAVAGQTNVAADSATDTLTLAGGSNVTITTTAGSDTVTIASANDNTTYTAGSGLVLHGTAFQAAVSGDNLLATNTPTDNYVPSWDASTRKFTWVAQPTDTNTTYTAGSGLALHGTAFQAAVSGDNLLATNTPTDNYVPSWDASTRKFTWVAQTADTNTTYTAGSGLSLNGTQFIAAVSGDNLLATNTPTDNYVPSWDASTRKFTWVAQPTDTNTTYTAGSGLVLHGTQFNIPMTTTSASGLVILTNTISSDQTTALTPKAVNDAGYITASSSDTLTNKTIGATQLTGTIASARLPDLAVSDFAASAIVTESEGIGSSDNDTSLPTSAAVKDYVDTQIATEDTIAELNDTNISSPAAGHLLIYDNTAEVWDNATLTEGSNVTITEGDGAITIAAADTTYTAGSGLVLHGTAFQAAVSGDNLLATNTPTDNYVPSWDASTRKFTWVAQTADTNTTYTAGSGLVLHGTAFQAAVSGDNLLATNTPTDNYVPSWDAATRKFTWVAQPTDTDTTYTAGSGLSLNGTQFITAVSGDNLLATNTPTDNYIPSWDASTRKFTWVAQTADTNTTYTAGSGLSLNGTQFIAAVSGDNLLATNTPTDNYVPSWDASTRKFTWVAQTSDTNTTYTAGTLLDLSSTTFNVDLSEASQAVMAAADEFIFLDNDDSSAAKRETLSDLLDTIAGTVGTTGLDRSGATLVVSDLHPVGVDGSANQLLTDDGDGSVTSESNLTFDGSTLTVAGVTDITDTTDASDATGDTGALRCEGGASIAKKLYVGTDLDVDGTTNLDAVDIDGDVDITGELKVTGAIVPGAGINAQTDDATIGIDCSEGNYYEVTLTANTTTTAINFTNVDTTFGQRIIVKFLQPADTSSGSAVLSAGAGFDDVTVNGGSTLTVKWPGGTAPTLTTGNSAADVFGFIIRSASSVDGFIIGQDIKAPS